MSTFIEVTLNLLIGFGETLKIFFVTLLWSMPLGLVICFGTMSKYPVIKWVTKTFVWVMRGTPLMLQLIVIYYGPGLLFELPLLPVTTATYLTFSLNYACYFSEIYRGGIESIPKGQYEAGQVLGMTKMQIFFQIVLMQVVKRVMAPVGNEVITLVKDTSIARIITYYELIFFAERFIRVQGWIWPLFYTGAFYLLFCGFLTLLFGYIEKKLDYYKG